MFGVVDWSVVVPGELVVVAVVGGSVANDVDVGVDAGASGSPTSAEGDVASSVVPHPTASTTDAAATAASATGWWCAPNSMFGTARSTAARNGDRRVLEACIGAHSIAWP